jgi:spore maturation protein CgeB
MSTGTCLVTNRTVVGINDLGFEEGTHFLGYDGQDEMVQQIQWALNNPNERKAIAKAGHELVRQNHQYKHRMHKILDIAGVALPA